MFKRKTPEEKEAERVAREKQVAEERAHRALEAERARRIATAQSDIEKYCARESPKWEYLTIFRKRGWTKDGWAEKFSVDMDTKLIELGEAGWELVAISSRSSVLGQQVTAGGATSIAIDYAGFTTDETWVFKRPKINLPKELVENLKAAKMYGQNT